MASAITHFIVGAALALPATESESLRRVLPGWAIPITAGILAVAPDLDTYVMRALRLPHASFFAHRGFFHSPFFIALSVSIAATIVARFALRPAVLLSFVWMVSAMTHPLLDMLTNGGVGVMLLFPFSDARLFFPCRPIHVSPLGVTRFFREAGFILQSEMPFCLGAIGIGSGLLALEKLLNRTIKNSARDAGLIALKFPPHPADPSIKPSAPIRSRP